MNFAKFLRTPFLQNTTGRLLLEKIVSVGEMRMEIKPGIKSPKVDLAIAKLRSICSEAAFKAEQRFKFTLEFSPES